MILLTAQVGAWGQAIRSGANGGGDASSKGPVSGPSDRLNFQADLFTGRFGYQVPLPLAPGRHDSAPGIGLSYNSAGDNGWCGVGWDLNLGYIQRQSKYGVPVAWSNGSPQKAYDDDKGFIFSLNGKGASLVNVAGNEYRAEIEGGFLRFNFLTSSNQWQVTDTGGNKYFFGQASGSRMVNSKSGWSSSASDGTYRWALSHVETVLGDTVDYTYTTIGGMLYPLKISCNGHTSGPTNTHTVDFILGTRSDVKLSYTAGYRVEQSQRLNAIVHKVSGQIVWSNRLAYAQSGSTARSLLQSVTRFGTNLTSSLPSVQFDYTDQSFGFQSAVNWTNVFIPNDDNGDPVQGYYKISYGAGDFQYADLLDMDGDGLPDRVFSTNREPYLNFFVQRNTGGGFANPVAFGALSVQKYSDSLINESTSNKVEWTALNTVYSRILDINGDGMPDRVADPLESLSGQTNYAFRRLAVQLNGSTNWASKSDVSWTNVFYRSLPSGDPAESDYRVIERDLGPQVLMVDMNGDNLPDRLMARLYGNGPSKNIFTNYWVQFNTGAGFTGTNYFGFPYYDQPASPGTYGSVINTTNVHLIDINGDGLPDRVMYPINGTTGLPEIPQNVTSYVVEFNNGYGFETPLLWGGIVADYLNGCGTAHYQPEYYLGLVQSIQDSEDFALRDINGDGMPDRIYRFAGCDQISGPKTNWMVQINQGTNFGTAKPYGPYSSQGQNTDLNLTAIQGVSAKLVDINGDGIPDHVMTVYPAESAKKFVVELSKGPFPDLLNSIKNGIGGTVAVDYKPSTKYNNHASTNTASRNLLPFIVQTVAAVSVSDGLYPSNTTAYLYEGGKWDSVRKEFDGFAKATQVDPLGLTNVHWFHQAGGRDNSTFGEYQDTNTAIGKKGMTFRTDTFGSDGKAYKLTLNKVDEVTLSGGQHFAFTSQTMSQDFPANGTTAYRATAQQFAYDLSNGNLTNTTDYGEVTNVSASAHTFTDITGDSTFQFAIFAALSNTNILDKPQRKILTSDSAGQNILRESLFSYDGNTGNLTQQRDRMCPTCYLTNGFGYDSYNNQTKATNEANIVTTTTFDTTYQTFPVQQTVAGTFTSTSSFDARSGKLLASTDVKGLVTANTYDVFFRPTETAVSATPNGTANVWLARYDYRLGLASDISTNSVRVRKSDGVDTSNGHESWTYSDGLGRVIQTREESETNNSFRVTDTVYDERGSLLFATLPYFSSGTNYTKPTTPEMGTLYAYDPVGRLTSVTAAVNGTFTSAQLTSTSATSGDTGSPVGSSAIDYNNGNDPWTLVTTDELGKIHRYSLDAYGRTNQIVEVTSGGNYTTLLKYTLAGDLTNLTDHANNQIQYAYNELGQVVALADPDMGVWQFQRDFAGRLRQQFDANSNQVVFNYNDVLGRLRTRLVYDYTGAFAYGVTNIYDASDDGKFIVYPGQLYQVIDPEGYTKNGYDLRGRVVLTARFLGKIGNTYTNQFAYDDADRVTQTVYPNGGPTITNIYDSGANLSQVKQVGGSNTVFYTARGFNALGQSLGVTFGNTVVTTNDYFANSKRLRRFGTFKTGSTNIQNLAYTYDAVSNLKSIADSVHTTNASAALTNLLYDDLHRLTSLTRPAINQTTTFGFDSIGNLTSNGEFGAGTYNYGVRMPHAVKSANGTNYAYDANGNMLVRGNQRLAYDPENHLAYVVTASGYSMFGCDAGGNRLWKQSSGTNALQVWIGGNYEEKNGQILFHVSAGGQTVCTFDKTSTNVFVYYHPDHLHSTAIETDYAGNRSQHYEYKAFGQDRFTESSSAFPVSRRYTGQVKDDETGLYYYNARYYDPLLGRFIQPDTIIPSLANPQHLNRYTYTLNNPLRYTDPSGHDEEDFDVPMTVGAAHAAMRQSAGGASAALFNKSNTEMQNGAAIGRAAAELNPVVGAFNSGYGAIAGKDAVDYHGLSTKERILSGVQAAAAVAPVALKTGEVISEGATILKATARGRAAEAKVLNEMGQIKNTQKVLGKEGKSIPDFINQNTVGEIKDTKRVTDSSQLRIQKEAAQQTGKAHELHTGVNTAVSENAARGTTVIRRPILGPSSP